MAVYYGTLVQYKVRSDFKPKVRYEGRVRLKKYTSVRYVGTVRLALQGTVRGCRGKQFLTQKNWHSTCCIQ